MPSPDDRRIRMERLMRTAALAALAWLCWGALAAPGRPTLRMVDARALPGVLRAWSAEPRADTLAVVFPLAPDSVVRAWLTALRRAGSALVWTGAAIPAMAVTADVAPGPLGDVEVRVSAPAAAPVVLHDALGRVDSATAAGGGAVFRVPLAQGPFIASVADQQAAAAPPAPAFTGAVVVLGRAGWEAKFLIQALEELGWMVEARLALAPGTRVLQGSPLPLNTARHVAVVALDSSAWDATAEIRAFVARGGGLIMTAEAARHPALAGLAPGTAAARPVSVTRQVTPSGEPVLPLFPIAPSQGAVTLERRAGSVAVAARRSGVARVLLVGYEDTWRWRLMGGEGGPQHHRAWWSDLVAAAAYRPSAERGSPAIDAAPLAAAVEALGPPAQALPHGSGATPWPGTPWVVLACVVAALGGEWVSRRTRGAS